MALAVTLLAALLLLAFGAWVIQVVLLVVLTLLEVVIQTLALIVGCVVLLFRLVGDIGRPRRQPVG